MNDERFQQLLADYVAGELDPADAGEFHAALRTDPARRKLAREMQAAAAALEVHLVTHEQAAAATESTAPPAVRVDTLRPRRAAGVLRAAPLLRYAAVVLIAFWAGLAVGTRSGSGAPADEGGASGAYARNVAPVEISPALAAKFTDVSRAHPGASGLSHALLALARP